MKSLDGKPLPAGLYLIATPIGNLRDISLRALEVLGAVDLVACEDTRVTGKLLQAHSLKNKMMSYNDHNADQRRTPILDAVEAGQAVALVSDAGMPLISDPGYKMVREAVQRGLMVTSVPGANAALCALQLSALPSDAFCFVGFLPPKTTARKKVLQSWASVPATLIFYESAPRLADSLRDMAEVLGKDRPAAVVREITKMFEEARRDTLSALAAHYDEVGAPKGEIVIVVGGVQDGDIAAVDIDEALQEALETMSVKEAAGHVAELTGQPRRVLYERALQLNRRQ
jgi:16S rRNA (cytidine1402-2'-O)-methyltransferase